MSDTAVTLDVVQNTPEWHQARLGIPTASNFQTVMVKGKGRLTYLYKCAGEILTGQPADNSYQSDDMRRGHVDEVAARSWYEFQNDVDIQEVGFVKNNLAGCSPDGLVGEDGAVEFKSALPHILIGHRVAGGCPKEHYAQVMGQLWITDRKWCDLVVYNPMLTPYVARVERDEEYIKDLADTLQRFQEELAEVVDFCREGDTNG